MFMTILWKWVYQPKQSTGSSNPYQAMNNIFHRTRTNNFTVCMEIQKASNSQSNLEEEEWNWRHQPAWLQTILRSNLHQDSTILAQRQKYQSMELTWKSRDKSRHLWILYLWQGDKTIQWRKDNLFKKSCWENWSTTYKRMKL